MRWTIPCIAACWLLAADPTAVPPGGAAAAPPSPAATARAAAGCVLCHPGTADVLQGTMATRSPERAFCRRALGREGDTFFSAACQGCHLQTCGDCHGSGDHPTIRPDDDACLRCHRGYFIGWDYHGRTPREDHPRYRRGPVVQGEPSLPMVPDLHAEAGLGCTDCHTVHGRPRPGRTGGGAVRTCRDCHRRIDRSVPEHAVAAHRRHLECWACHAAWTAQAYGSTLVHPRSGDAVEAFAGLPRAGSWYWSTALRRQGPPPLGLDARGLVSPIRPEFILLATDPARGWENRLLAAEWRAMFPHTVRRGSVPCQGCHGNARRFLLAGDADPIYRPDRDGAPLRSWWDRTGQTVRNGGFFPAARYARMNRRTPAFVRQWVRRWRQLADIPAAPSSGP